MWNTNAILARGGARGKRPHLGQNPNSFLEVPMISGGLATARPARQLNTGARLQLERRWI